MLYRIHCASCHGSDARGGGPVAEMLTVPPPDLSRLRDPEEKGFPAERVRRAIDGRSQIAAHGKREMPVWGLSFQVAGLDRNQEPEVAERLDRLVDYLRSIQRADSP